MPPSAACDRKNSRAQVASRPTVNSRLISRPASRKKIVSRPSFTQCSSDIRTRVSASSMPRGDAQNAVNPGPSGELTSSTARIDTRTAAGRSTAPSARSHRRRMHAVAKRAEHRFRERRLVPRPVVAAPIDEECRCHPHAARACTSDVCLDARPPAGARRNRGFVVAGSSEVAGHGVQVFLGKRGRAGHQRDVCAPEGVEVRCGLGDFRCAAGEVIGGDRQLPEHVAQAVAEAVAQVRDLVVGGAQ